MANGWLRRQTYRAAVIGALVAGFAGAAVAGDWASVIMYHRFGENTYPATNIRIDQFEAHLAELATGGYTVLPLPDIVAKLRTGGDLPDRTLAITIDDAYASVYQQAWPRLRAAGLPFTLFVATDPIDHGLAGYMTWDQLRELAEAGVTIGSQTASHPHMPNQNRARNEAEIGKSNRRFRTELGATPETFAYPYGEYGSEVKDIVSQSGFLAAFGQHSGVAYAGSDPFSWPRFAMNETYGSLSRFRLAVNALPLKIADRTPADTFLTGQNPPLFGFTVTDDLPNLQQLACFASNQSGPATLERLGERRIEVRLEGAFQPGRGRINCTLPGPNKRWRWFGTQFYIPRE
jgi:peptidoglycan/xylan/chitin deacetylase (PgdA/CDA1 family)